MKPSKPINKSTELKNYMRTLFLNESLSDKDLTFRTPISMKDIYVYGEELLINSVPDAITAFETSDAADIELTDTNMFVNWQLDLELREYGIKNIGVSIISVEGELWFVDLTNDVPAYKFPVMFENGKDGWTIDVELTMEGAVFPGDLSIDFQKKTISITK